MKLPHITIEYREEGTFAPGKMSWPLIVGFGFHWAWIYLAMHNSDLLFSTVTPELQSLGFGVSLAVFSATLFCYGIFLEPMRRLFATARARRRNRLLGACFTVLGTAMLAAVGLSDTLALPIAIASGLLTGVGSAVLLMSYGVSFSVCDIATVTLSTALAFFLGSVIYAAIMAIDAVAHPVGTMICVFIPLVELLCLNRSSAQLVDNLQFDFATMSVHTVPFALHVFLPSLIFGLILGIVRPLAVSGFTGADGPFQDYGMALVLAGAAAGLLVIVSMFMQRQSNNFLFRTLVPVIALLIASLALLDEPGGFYTMFALFASYLLLEACVWVFYADISQRFRISAFTVFGFGRGSLALGTFVGFLLMQPQFATDAALQDYGTLAAVAFVTLMFGVSLLPKNAELRRTLKRGAACPALQGDDESFHLEAEMAASRAGEQGATSDAGQEVEAGVEVDEARLEVIEQAEQDLEARESEDASGKRVGRFKRKCAVVAETYLLSRKETEVLFLLAKGKNSAAIQEQLYISAGTANTHMRHIYRKLDVHSQQALMALVEEVEVEPADWE